MSDCNLPGKKLNKQDCLLILQQKKNELDDKEENRLPCRSDFTENEVNAIKSFLGPWPRALEASGIKPPRDISRKLLNHEKHIRAKRNRTIAKKQAEKEINEKAQTEKLKGEN